MIGYGSMGKRHAENIVALGHDILIYDPPLGYEHEPILDEIDAEVVSTPANDRRYRLVPTFAEKPIAKSIAWEYWDDRDDLPWPHPFQVGYQLRFDAALQRIHDDMPPDVVSARVFFSQRLTDWQPSRDYRTTPYAKTGIVLEASHELDLIRYLFGTWSWCSADVGTYSDLELSVPDSAHALIGMSNGIVVTLSLDMVGAGYERGIDILCASGQRITWRPGAPAYREEMDAFLRAVASGEPDPRAANLEDGIAALKLGEALVLSSRERRTVFNPEAAEVEGSAFDWMNLHA